MIENKIKSAYGFDLEGVAQQAIVMGDPQRVKLAATLLVSPQLLWDVREYRAYTGLYNGQQVTVASHGVGSAGAALAFEDLFRAGVTRIIRSGTCGALSTNIPNGAMIIVTAAIREDGASAHLLPQGFPAVADNQMVNDLYLTACGSVKNRVFSGIVWSSDLFYPPKHMQTNEDIWRQCGVLGAEMEMATLFVLASISGAKAGGILLVEENGSNLQNTSEKDTRANHASQLKMLEIALDSLTKKSK